MFSGPLRTVARAGGISGVAFAIGYIVIVGLYVPMGAPPTGAEAKLAYLAAHERAWWGILILSVATDLLLIPFTAALCMVLRRVSPAIALFGAICAALFVVLDLAITWTNWAVLLAFADQYAAAGSDRAALVGSAAYPAAVVESTLLFVYNSLTLAVGILLAGTEMRAAGFSRAAAWSGVITGVLGVVAVGGPLVISALSGTIIAASVMTMIWVALTAWDLLHRQPDSV